MDSTVAIARVQSQGKDEEQKGVTLVTRGQQRDVFGSVSVLAVQKACKPEQVVN